METSKDYTIHYKVANTDHGVLTVPAGTRVTHQTACGIDESYHFVDSFDWVKPHDSGIPQHGLLHDLKYYGLNVPKEYVA